MTRGDQRERDRERAKKRSDNGPKTNISASNLRKKQESDADIMRLKQLKAQEKKTTEPVTQDKK